ncbi:MAG: hypothetical protein AAF267_11745 [Deinococcota bacterium]
MLTIHRLGQHLLGKSNEFTELSTGSAHRFGQALSETSSLVDLLNHCAINIDDTNVLVSFSLPKTVLQDLINRQEHVSELVFSELFLLALDVNDQLRNDLFSLFEAVATEA